MFVYLECHSDQNQYGETRIRPNADKNNSLLKVKTLTPLLIPLVNEQQIVPE